MPASAVARAVPLETVFDQLQEILARHAKLFTELTGQVKNKRDYHLIVNRPMVIDGREKDGLYFASLIQQKDAVGFYFMPIYCCAEVKAELSPELLRHLDGKSCFHPQSADTAVEERCSGGPEGRTGSVPGETVAVSVLAFQGNEGRDDRAPSGVDWKPRAYLMALLEALVDFRPVDHVPPLFQVVGAAVLVLQVVGVLPDVVAHDREKPCDRGCPGWACS